VVVDCCNLHGNATNGVIVAQSGSLMMSTVLIKNCNTSGYSSYSAAVNVSGTVTGLQITGCAGYNDQNAPLNGGVAPTSAASAATCSTPYFGPSIFSYGNNSSITVNLFGVNVAAPAGVYFLPSATDSFHLSGTPLTFQWLGK
jgi:hypothetical protein